MTRRWVCPKCRGGVLAPSKPRVDDVRRYCLDCSRSTGRLVPRICPARERKAALKEVRKAAGIERRSESPAPEVSPESPWYAGVEWSPELHDAVRELASRKKPEPKAMRHLRSALRRIVKSKGFV